MRRELSHVAVAGRDAQNQIKLLAEREGGFGSREVGFCRITVFATILERASRHPGSAGMRNLQQHDFPYACNYKKNCIGTGIPAHPGWDHMVMY